MKGHDQDQNGVQTAPPSQCQGIHIWPLLFQNQFLKLQSWNGYVGSSFVAVLSSNYFGSSCHLGGQGHLKSGW